MKNSTEIPDKDSKAPFPFHIKKSWPRIGIYLLISLLTIITILVTNALKENEWEKLSQNKSDLEEKKSDRDQDIPNENNNNNSRQYIPRGWDIGCEGQDRVQLTHSPMEYSDFEYILPIGTFAGAHVTPIDHLYFSPTDFNSPRDKYPVYAMADGYIVEVGVRRINIDSGAEKLPEYRIIFQHSCQTFSYFDLVTSLDKSILDQIPQLKGSDYASGIHVPVKGGQLIGRIGGQTLDTAVYNMNLLLPGFISPELYEIESWKIHTDDFFTYFDEPIKTSLLKKNLRVSEPRGGKIDYDQAGKLVGNWFKEGTNGYAGVTDNTDMGYWIGHLSITYDAIKPEYIVISVGNFNGKPMQFYVKGNSPDPTTITSKSGIVKYELIDTARYFSFESLERTFIEGRILGTVLFELEEGKERLKVEIFPEKDGSTVNRFTNNVAIYVR